MDATALRRIVLATAGRMQATLNDSLAEGVRESDLQAALRDSGYPHAERVRTEVSTRLAHWPKVGATDVVMHDKDGRDWLIECKWCQDKHKVAESLWDALKLASLTAQGTAIHGVLLFGAREEVWKQSPTAPLFQSGDWTLPGLLADFEAEWHWLFRSVRTARPTRLPAAVHLDHLTTAAIANGDVTWLLRAVAVHGEDWLSIEEDGRVLVEEADEIPPDLQERMNADAAREGRDRAERAAARSRDPAYEPIRIVNDQSLSLTEKHGRLTQLTGSSDERVASEAASQLRTLSMRKQMQNNPSDAPPPGTSQP